MVFAGIIPSAILLEDFPTEQPASNPEYNPNFFFDGFSEDCQLPCWYGLVVGETSEADTLAFLEGLAFPEGIIKHRAFVEGTSYNGWYTFQDYKYKLLIENIEQKASTIIYIHTLFKNEILEGIIVGGVGDGVLDMSPNRVIDVLGTPSAVNLQQFDRTYSHTLMLSYNPGIYFQYIIAIKDLSSEQPTQKFCLDVEQWLDKLPEFSMSIINPNAEGIQSLTVERNGLLKYYVPLEKVSDLSVQEFAEALQNDESVCIELTNTVPILTPTAEGT
jgi:hypothetical protein